MAHACLDAHRFAFTLGRWSGTRYWVAFIQASIGMMVKLALRLPLLSNDMVIGSDWASAGILLIMRWLPPGRKTIWPLGAMVISLSGRIVVPLASNVVVCICTSAASDAILVRVIASVP